MKELFNSIERNEEKYIRFWADICRFETNSRKKDEINRLNDFIESFAREEGFVTKRFPFTLGGDYMTIDLNPTAEKGYLFIAHTDTVFEDGVFGEDIVKVEDGKMYGPGVIDCKGGIAMALLIMRAFAETGYKKNLRFILVSDEEVNNCLAETGIEVIKENSKGYLGAFCCEVGKAGEVLVGRKGVLRFNLKVIGKSAHSGIDYFDGINSIYEASKKIIAFQEASKKDGPTYSCNIINAGTVFNIIPGECSFSVDIRVKNGEQRKEAVETLERIVNTDYIGGTSCETVKMSERSPFAYSEENMRLFESLKAAGDELGLEALNPAENGGGSDAAYTAAAGVPTVCAIGTTGDFCHTKDEYADISSLVRRAKIISKVIYDNN